MPNLSSPPCALLDGAALFLDFDGTLIELAESPDAIQVAPELGSLLRRLCRRLDGRVAVVSGRALSNLRHHLPAAGIGLSGSHGLELTLPDGTELPLERPPQVGRVHARVHAFAAERPALLVETKPAGVALHFRQAPQEAAAVAGFMEGLARDEEWVVQRGNMVVELRPPGADKGDAVRSFMRTPAFAGARPVFVGDDLTDEHAFAAAAALGGAGVLVGPERETAARYRLPSVTAVAEWLEACA